MSNKKGISFVLMINGDFWLGFAALVESIYKNSKLDINEYEFIVYSDDIPECVRSWAERRIESIVFHNSGSLKNIKIPPGTDMARFRPSFWKLPFFGISGNSFSTCIAIDADIICLNSLRPMLSFTPPYACSHESNWELAGNGGNTYLNAGMHSFIPSEDLFENVINHYYKNPEAFKSWGDQNVLNLHQDSSHSIEVLKPQWNNLKGYYHLYPKEEHDKYIAKTHFLHFTGTKPWGGILIKRSEGKFLKLEKIWWTYFRQSGFEWKNSLPQQLGLAWPYLRVAGSVMTRIKTRSIRLTGNRRLT